jgi:hypothetical protein
MKIRVYKSKFSDKLYHLNQRQEFIEHLYGIREKLREERKLTRARREFQSWFAKEKEQIFSLSDIHDWVRKNFKQLVEFYNSQTTSTYNKFDTIPELEEFGLSGAFLTSASNTHSAPRGYQTNCGGLKSKDGVPRGYPGFYGRIEGKFKNYHRGGITELFNMIDIRTGSGSGGSRFGYEMTIWSYDWINFREEALFNKLANR